MTDDSRAKLIALALSASALVSLVSYESYTGQAVIPIPGDVPTIGFGTTEGVKMGDKITPPVALARALRDAQKFEGALKTCVTVPLHQYEYDAYIILSYNIGAKAFCDPSTVWLDAALMPASIELGMSRMSFGPAAS